MESSSWMAAAKGSQSDAVGWESRSPSASSKPADLTTEK